MCLAPTFTCPREKRYSLTLDPKEKFPGRHLAWLSVGKEPSMGFSQYDQRMGSHFTQSLPQDHHLREAGNWNIYLSRHPTIYLPQLYSSSTFISQKFKNLQFERRLVSPDIIGQHYLKYLLEIQFSHNHFYLNRNHGQSLCTNFTHIQVSYVCKRGIGPFFFSLFHSISFKHYILSYSLKPLNLYF